jgi:hypothetical protein
VHRVVKLILVVDLQLSSYSASWIRPIVRRHKIEDRRWKGPAKQIFAVVCLSQAAIPVVIGLTLATLIWSYGLQSIAVSVLLVSPHV